MADAAQPVPDDQDGIDVTPTKAFFVDMLTKDVQLNRAIVDLVDNCVDGARRLRPGNDQSFAGLEVRIVVNPGRFEIRDNCGGIGIELAKKYAFRIGRPKEMPSTPGAVGQFGIGMKRALFKLGHKFRVSSNTTSDRFVLDVDVDLWLEESGWHFRFSEAEAGLTIAEAETGTRIEVWDLRDGVVQSFSNMYSINSLHRDIQAAQQYYIDRGLSIALNNTPMLTSRLRLLRSAALSPARIIDQFDAQSPQPIKVTIFAGIADSDPRAAGWYIFCNGRLVLEADQTSRTGWDRTIDTIKAPKYHNQFARFRGFVYFDCDDAAKLPWNTTKTGVDEDSAVYQAVREKMVAAMRPVIDFLNDLDREQELPVQERELDKLVTAASATPIKDLEPGNAFAFAVPPPPVQRPVYIGISYQRSEEKIDELKEALGAGSAKAVGERSFDIVYRDLVEKNK